MALQIFDTLPSTMDVARQNVLSQRLCWNADGWPDSDGVLAREQTRGRGQRGRVWFIQPGESLSATYYVSRQAWGSEAPNLLSMAAGLAVAQAIQTHVETASGSPQPHVGLKWPNDILLNGRKASGILIESVPLPSNDWVALVGIGVNLGIREFPSEIAETATSFRREGLTPPDLEPFALVIAHTLHTTIDLHRKEGSASLLDHWREWDTTGGRVYETEHDGEVIVGTADGVDTQGRLLLRLADGPAVALESASSLRER